MQASEVLAEDLALGLLGELRVAALLDDVSRELEVPELLERPLRVPDRRLAAVDDLVLPAPPHHLPERLGEDPRLAGDEVHRRRDRGVEVGIAHDLPQDLVEPWEPDVEDHEVDVGDLAAAPSISNVRVCSIGCGPSGTPLWTPIRSTPSSCAFSNTGKAMRGSSMRHGNGCP